MNNVAVGYQAALCTTTGDQNTAIGSCALRLNTTAANNTAVGFRVLLSNTTGTNNTAVGSNALCANVEGDQSTVAIGHEALRNQNPVGNADMNNVAVGYQAAALYDYGGEQYCGWGLCVSAKHYGRPKQRAGLPCASM
jgi:trimeric autotransporter adhesin